MICLLSFSLSGNANISLIMHPEGADISLKRSCYLFRTCVLLICIYYSHIYCMLSYSQKFQATLQCQYDCCSSGS